MRLTALFYNKREAFSVVILKYSDFNIDRYFNEFCFWVNRSQSKATIFNNLIVKMVKADKIYQNEIISN